MKNDEIRNDLELSEWIQKVHTNSGLLDYYYRELKERELFIALSDIELAAKNAQWRLNELKFAKK